MILKEGDLAPDFTVSDQNGNAVSLAQMRGKTVVLFFYPKADTPGCTAEACAFRDAQDQFDSSNTVLLGISADPISAQQKFATKYGLPFRLLADEEHKTAEAYGVWGEKSMYGKKYFGIDRTTFLIDAEGKIARIWPKVKVEGHADEVLAAVRALNAG
jgi:peroxiredoxin Q/BCP